VTRWSQRPEGEIEFGGGGARVGREGRRDKATGKAKMTGCMAHASHRSILSYWLVPLIWAAGLVPESDSWQWTTPHSTQQTPASHRSTASRAPDPTCSCVTLAVVFHLVMEMRRKAVAGGGGAGGEGAGGGKGEGLLATGEGLGEGLLAGEGLGEGLGAGAVGREPRWEGQE
jgi:hypothetical protein